MVSQGITRLVGDWHGIRHQFINRKSSDIILDQSITNMFPGVLSFNKRPIQPSQQLLPVATADGTDTGL
jgi:hypothetical protein